MGQFNNPAIGAAFGNISEMFSPPSGTDAYRFAEATAARQEAARKAAAYAMALDPSTTHETLDRANYALGNGTPSQGYYGVDTTAATARRGQDITAATSRYDTDARSQADIGKTLAGPLSAGQIQPDSAGVIAKAYGFDGVTPQRGIVTLNQGEKSALPDGSVIQGNPKPYNESEWKAAQLSNIFGNGPQSGPGAAIPGGSAMVSHGSSQPAAPTGTATAAPATGTDQDKHDQLMNLLMGDSARAPVQVRGPDGKPSYMDAGTAARRGAPAYNPPNARDVYNYKGPDGSTGTATFDGQTLRDTQTGAQLPHNTQVQSATSGATVNINNGENSLLKTLGETTGKQWGGYLEAADAAAGMKNDMDMLEELGKMAPQGPIAGRIAAAFPGISSSGAAFQSIINRLAPHMRATGSGSTSNVEFEGMLNSLPAMQNQPEANAAIAAAFRAKGALDTARAAVVRDYQAGNLTQAQASSKIAEINAQSILSPELKAKIAALGPQPAAGETPAAPAGGPLSSAPSGAATAPAAPAQGAPAQNSAPMAPSARAIEALKADPTLSGQFDEKYGSGAAKRALVGG